MENKEQDHNFRSSPRADSFVDIVTDDAMDVDVDIDADVDAAIDDDDDAIIKCICGFGKGFDDDDATACGRCETWQHNLCYFHVLGRKVPGENDPFLCADCGPSHEFDANLASSRMQRKVQTLAMIADRISELTCEILVRGEELVELECKLACVESDLYLKGPLLEPHGSAAAWSILDEWHEEWCLIKQDIAKTLDERDAIRFRIEELEDDQSRVRRNEPTLAEEIKAHLAKVAAAPRLWTTAGSLGKRSCHQYSLPPTLKTKGDPVLTMHGDGKGKVGKRKRTRGVR